MLLKSLGAVAALLMTTSFAHAAFDAQSVAAQLQSDGYSRIEIKVGQNIAKVEAIKGTTKIEVTYDIASGDVIKTETEQLADDDNNSSDPAVSGGDDGPNHDINDDHGASHDMNDDHGDDGPNHDVNDDHGGDDNDQGDDHGGNSGHGGGGDDGGNDDHGGQSGHDGGDDD